MNRIRLFLFLLAAAILFAGAAAAEGESGPVRFRSAGDIVLLGQYEQDRNIGNGPEPIEWIILEMQEGRCLLLSRYGLDAMPYNTASVNITWEQCTLRAWLNGTFLESSFSGEEQAAILLTDVDNSREHCYSGYSTNGGVLTQDKIFLLSWKEADRYFPGVMAKMCSPTGYAVENGAWTSDSYTLNGKAAGSWWLRSPGLEQHDAIRVGNISARRDDVSQTRNCVRPALWFNLNHSGLLSDKKADE